jgi:hypothetical protein
VHDLWIDADDTCQRGSLVCGHVYV